MGTPWAMTVLVYDSGHVERLNFIRHCRALGMSLDDVQTLLDFRDHPNRPCGGVNDLVDSHISQIDQQLAELKVLHAELSQLRAKCDSTRASACCEILKQLGDTGGLAETATSR
jgi:DNA-binding transcriptional MerR regulator